MSESPLMSLLYAGIAVYIAYLYRCDLLAGTSDQPNSGALPGATSAPARLYVTGVVGAVLILALETFGELALGIAAEQSYVPWFFIFTSLGAGVIEEVIFRGFLVVEHRGRVALVTSCVGFSLLFAVLHPFLWEFNYPETAAWWEFWQAKFNFILTSKACFTTAILFLNSLWFYTLRFGPWNKKRSLLPCMLAHAVSNLGVYLVKYAQGYVVI